VQFINGKCKEITRGGQIYVQERQMLLTGGCNLGSLPSEELFDLMEQQGER
jgi:hypothetical protein